VRFSTHYSTVELQYSIQEDGRVRDFWDCGLIGDLLRAERVRASHVQALAEYPV